MISLAPAIRTARLQALAAAIDAGSEAAQLTLYGGERPPPGEAASGPALVALTLPRPFAQEISDGRLVMAPPEDGMATAGGLASWARITTGDGSWALDLDVGTTGSGADIELATTQLYPGGLVRITAGEILEP